MKKLDITLGDVYDMEPSVIGDNLLQLRRKKKTTKRLVVVLPAPAPLPLALPAAEPKEPKKILPPPPLVVPPVKPLPTPKAIVPPIVEPHYKPPMMEPMHAIHEVTTWNTSGSPFRNLSPYHSSPFIRQAFFMPPSAEPPMLSPQSMASFAHSFMPYQGIVGGYSVIVDNQLSPSPMFQYTPPMIPSMTSHSPSIFTYQPFNYVPMHMPVQTMPAMQTMSQPMMIVKEEAGRMPQSFGMSGPADMLYNKPRLGAKKPGVPALNLDSIKN